MFDLPPILCLIITNSLSNNSNVVGKFKDGVELSGYTIMGLEWRFTSWVLVLCFWGIWESSCSLDVQRLSSQSMVTSLDIKFVLNIKLYAIHNSLIICFYCKSGPLQNGESVSSSPNLRHRCRVPQVPTAETKRRPWETPGDLRTHISVFIVTCVEHIELIQEWCLVVAWAATWFCRVGSEVMLALSPLPYICLIVRSGFLYCDCTYIHFMCTLQGDVGTDDNTLVSTQWQSWWAPVHILYPKKTIFN